MRRSLLLVSLLLFALVSFGSPKKKEEATQTLAIPRELPSAAVGITRNLQFQNSTLVPRGLLSAQTRDAVREIIRLTNGMQVVEIRAFVAGTGDLRRVPQIVSETFTEKKHSAALPAVSVIQVGGLAVEGAQIALEAISESKRETNPHGLVFTKAVERSANRPFEPLAPLALQALHDVESKLAGRGHAARITCFASASEDAAAIRSSMASVFPGVLATLLQTVRTPSRSSVACEAVARADADRVAPDPAIAVVDSERVVFTGMQVAFGISENDARLAYRRLERVLSGANAPLRTASLLRLYPLSPSVGAQAARLSGEFVDPKHPPLLSLVQFEGLPGLDASFAVEAIAPAPSSFSRSSAMLNQ